MADIDLDSLAKPVAKQEVDLDSLATSPAPLMTEDGRFRVIDGDTIEEVSSGERLRLNGIDASEKGRIFSDRSKKNLKTLLDQGGNVRVDRKGVDHSGERTVADLYTEDGTSINTELVRRGVAPDTYKGGDPDLRRAGRAASLNYMGMGDPTQATVEAQLEVLATPRTFDPNRVPRSRKRTLGQEAGAGVRRGIDSLQAAGYGAVALAGSAIGSDTMRDWGMEGYNQQLSEAAESAPSVDFKEMEFGENFFQWAAGAFGEALPSMGSMVLGGGIGAQAGKAFVKRQVERKLKKEAQDKLEGMGLDAGAKQALDKALANELTHRKMYRAAMGGAGVGAFTMSAVPQGGDVFAEIYQEAGVEAPGTAAIAAGLGGLLDTAAGGALITRLFPGKAKKEVKNLLIQAAKVSGQQTLIEGTTEGAQEFIASVARSLHDPDYDPLGEEAMDRVKAAAATGALVGAVSGGIGGPLTAKKAPKEEPPPPPATEDKADEVAAPTPEEAAVEEPAAPPAEAVAFAKTLKGLVPNRDDLMDAIALETVTQPDKDPLTKERAEELVKAQERGLKPEDVPKGVTVEVEATVDGQQTTVQMPAQEALKMLDTEIATYERLARCVKA